MTPAFHRQLRTLLAVLLVATPAVAFAQITQAPAPGVFPSYTHRNTVVFEPVNNLYFVLVWDPPFGPVLTGRFLDKAGNPVTGDFQIADDLNGEGAPAFAAWASVAAGGPANDPAILVTYTVADASNIKYGRLIRFNGGLPTVSPRSPIADVGNEWFASEKAQSFWNGTHFVVGTRVLPPGYSLPTFQANLFDMNGNVGPAVQLGDGGDFYGSPAIACGAGTCMAFGFKAGIPGGYSGGSYGRLFNAATLAPQ